MIKAFIFDMDGVIIDSEPMHLEIDKMVMKDFGIKIPDEELNVFVGVTNIQMWSELRASHKLKASVEELLEKQNEYKKQMFGRGDLSPINGITELIEDLKDKGIKIGLASSSSKEFIELVLRNLNIYDEFNIIVGGGDVSNSKPAPDIFLKAAEFLKVAPEECMVLEDSSHGVKAAKTAGMKCIAFKNPNSGEQDLSLADLAVDTLENLNYMDL